MTDGKLIDAILRAIPGKARNRAAKAGIGYSLPDGYVADLYQRQEGRCDVTGLPFSMLRIPEAFVKHPFAPSLDRKNSHLGYVVGDVRLVRVCVNFGLGQWGQEVFLTCARAAVEHDRALINITTEPSAMQDANPVQKVLPNSGPSLQTEFPAISEWHARMRDRIDAAVVISNGLSGDDLARQTRRIASLKRNLKLGPEGLALAASRAGKTKAAQRFAN